MILKDIIHQRRAYRSLSAVRITDELVRDLAECAALSPSCFNNQPWRFVFASDPNVVKKMHSALARGNEWGLAASMFIGVFSKRSLDCNIKEREYYLFDTGMATAFLILRATEMGLVAHPIAGYDEKKAQDILHIPEEMRLITLVLVGKKSEGEGTALSERQREIEETRPERLPFERFAFIDRYHEESDPERAEEP